MVDLSFYKNKTVLLTGHTGFKGAWMSQVLLMAGANLFGYSRCSQKEISLYKLLNLDSKMESIKGDVRDLCCIQQTVQAIKPDIVIHMAAQPIVRESYKKPVETYETNVLGTLNVLESIRNCDNVCSFLNVTTDKVYFNCDQDIAFTEDFPLDGYDPYSNSKSCSELITHCYSNCFFTDRRTAISTARAGNVIGGGDYALDRIIPDCVRAAINDRDIIVRNPFSTRPYQHVLEPIMAYLLIAQNFDKSGWYNVGPDEKDCFETGKLVDTFIKYWGEGLSWVNKYDGGPHEAGFLKLDNSKMKNTFDWKPTWDLDTAIKKTVEWYKVWRDGQDIITETEKEIREFLK